MPEYIYKLKLALRLQDDAGWTEDDEEIIDAHFKHLVGLHDKGIVILAGRTLNEAKSAFGIAIFNADDESSALDIMRSDPAIREGIMSAELFPFKVAIR
jgi:uncharacterized protein